MAVQASVFRLFIVLFFFGKTKAFPRFSCGCRVISSKFGLRTERRRIYSSSIEGSEQLPKKSPKPLFKSINAADEGLSPLGAALPFSDDLDDEIPDSLDNYDPSVRDDSGVCSETGQKLIALFTDLMCHCSFFVFYHEDRGFNIGRSCP